MNFARSYFGQFMASIAGRILRVVGGLTLVVLGFWLAGGWGAVLVVVGAVPLLAGTFDVCVLSALVGGPFSGERIRALARRA